MSTPFEPSLVRKGLNDLLQFFPHFDVISVDWQMDAPPGEPVVFGPWVLVSLGQPSQIEGHYELVPPWAVWKFAIWRATGAVHTMNEYGAVSDDPIFPVKEKE